MSKDTDTSTLDCKYQERLVARAGGAVSPRIVACTPEQQGPRGKDELSLRKI